MAQKLPGEQLFSPLTLFFETTRNAPLLGKNVFGAQ